MSRLQEAGVTGGFVIMAPLKDGTAEGVIGRYVDTAFVGEDTGFHLPVGKAGAEGERDILVHGLKCLEDERVTCGSRFNAVGEGGVNKVNKERGWEEGDVGVIRIVRWEEVGSAGESVRAR